MRGYPKHIATRQDFINLLGMPEHKERALVDLKAIYQLNDSKVSRATTPIDPADPEKGWNTEEIDNPMPLWKVKGFSGRDEVAAVITEYGGEV